MNTPKNKKIKDLLGSGLKPTPVGGNRVKPQNEYTPFERSEIEQSVPQRFETIAAAYPGHIAIKLGTETRTYRQLNRHANQVAHRVLEEYDDRFKLSEEEKQRYSRQMRLHGWGIEAQEKLKGTTVFVAGAGGSGSPVIMQLALAGFGTIIVCDGDEVDLSNLNRQVLHDQSRIGMNKAISAQKTVARINPHVKVIAHAQSITAENIDQLLGDSAIIFDNVDDIRTKFLLSRCAVARGIPHVLSSMIDMNSYAAILHPPEGPCFHCLYDRHIVEEIEEIDKLKQAGGGEYESFSNPVVSPSLFVSAGFAVNEALKVILGFEKPAFDRYFLFDQRGMDQIVHSMGYRQIVYPFSRHFRELSKRQGIDWEKGINEDQRFVAQIATAPDPQCPLCSNIEHEAHTQITYGTEGDTPTSINPPPQFYTRKPQHGNETHTQITNGTEGDATTNINPPPQFYTRKPQHGAYTREPAPRAVGVLFSHNLEMIAGILGVLKAGMSYVPLDASYPVDRLAYMLEDSEARVIVTIGSYRELAEQLRERVNRNIKIVYIENLSDDVADQNPGISISPTDLAYILFTSGSTGKPKGVMQSHRNVLHHARVYTNALHIHKQDRLTLFSSFGFDAAKMDIYGALLNGATLYPYNIKKSGHLQQLPRWLAEEGITIYHSIPTVYRYFIDQLEEESRFPSLRFIVLGGEAVFKKDVDNYKKYFSDRCIFINGLGPTESTVTVQYFIDKKTEITREAVPVGYAVADTTVYLLTPQNRDAGVMGVGEIIFKSDHLALGYWKNPEQTQKVFVSDPLTGEGRVYRTGDLGRRLADGTIEFVGRSDFQVKISGYRVELGEIESKLDRVEGIGKSVVVCRQDENGENYLAAYYTLKNRQANLKDEAPEAAKSQGETPGTPGPSAQKLAQALKQTLPDYMVPSLYFYLEEFPLTATGKIDRKVLAQQDISHLIEKEKPEPPATDIERQLHTLWQDVLKRPVNSVTESFFLKGGNSIKAILLVSVIFKAMDVKLSLIDIFKHPTIRELSRHIGQSGKVSFRSIHPAEPHDYYPVTSAQRRIYFLSQFEDIGTVFNMSIGLKIVGQLQLERYKTIIDTLVQRHDALRTSFALVKGEPVQQVHPAVNVQIQQSQIKTFEEIKTFIRPFNLEEAPLFRVGLFSTSNEEHYLIFDAHHIIFDGASLTVLAADFKKVFEGRRLEPLRIQYKDFAVWQQQEFAGGVLNPMEAYWLELYKDAAEGSVMGPQLPTDFPRPAVMNYQGANYRFGLSRQQSDALKQLANREGASLYMVLLAIYNIFLARLTKQEDIIVATITAGRNHADTAGLIGVFVNMLAMRNFPVSTKTFKDFLQEVKDSTLKAFENRDYPFETLVEQVAAGQERDMSRSPLTDVGFTLQNLDIDPDVGEPVNHTGDEPQLEIKSLKSYRDAARNDLNLEGFEMGGQLQLDFQYRTSLFTSDTIEAFSRYLTAMMDSVLKDPDRQITDIDIMSPEQQLEFYKQLQRQEEERAIPTLVDLFQRQVEETPEALAIVSTIEEKNIYDQLKSEPIPIEMTYEELDERARQLERVLRFRGLKENGMVGLMVRHPLELAVAIWGILKAGGAYVPIDPEYPGDLVRFILQDSRVPFLVVQEDLEEDLPDLDESLMPTIVYTDDDIDEDEYEDQKEVNPVLPKPQDLAYVIYTSGTTGRPKGVPVPHEGIVNYTQWRIQQYGLTQEDVTLQPLSVSFDGFGSNFYSALLSGGTLVIVPGDKRTDALYLKHCLVANRVTNISFVPGMYRMLLNTMSPKDLVWLRLVVLAGEDSGKSLIEKSHEMARHILLVNEYGPTETAVTATAQIPIDATHTSIIGTPIRNRRVLILDNRLKPVPPLFPGELCIGGPGIALGYLNNPQLTAEKFLPTPQLKSPYSSYSSYSSQKSPLYYKTGDMARWLLDGTIQFLGRIDQQIKIRGYRVELAQIDALLKTHPNVKDAAVTVRGDGEDKYICAYAVVIVSNEACEADLKKFLGRRLADYMVPAFVILLESIPLTPTGKIDYRALPEPCDETDITGVTPPASETEHQLVEIWSDVLRKEKDAIGITSNFFELGGHSLKATQLISTIHKTMDIKIPQAEVFKSPTIKDLAQYIDGQGQSAKDRFKAVPLVEDREYYPLSSAQLRMYILQQMTPGNTAYNMPFARKLENAPQIDIQKLTHTFRRLIQRHESLRTSFPVIDGQPVQRVHADVSFDIQRFAPPEEKAPNQAGEWLETVLKSFIQPFDLTGAPLIRVALVQLPAADKNRNSETSDQILMVDMHHIISDGISHHILLQDFEALYNETQLLPLRLHYKEFAQWQQSFIRTPSYKRQEEYWLNRFRVPAPRLSMPLDYPRPERQSLEGRTIDFDIPPKMAHQLEQMAITHHMSLNILILAIYTLLLHKYSGQQDILVGSLVAGRNHKDLEQIIGMFANFLPLRFEVTENQSFSNYLETIKETTLDAYENQDYPFEELIHKLNLPVDLGRNALWDTMVVFHNQIDPHAEEQTETSPTSSLHSSAYHFQHHISTLDFKLDVSIGIPGKLSCRLQYDTQLFKEESMQTFIHHFQLLMQQALEAPQSQLKDMTPFQQDEEETVISRRQQFLPKTTKSIKLVLASTFTADPMMDYISWWGNRFDLDLNIEATPYNQVFQQLLLPDSPLTGNTGVNVLLVRFEDWIRDISHTRPTDEIIAKLESDFKRFIEILKSIPKPGPYLAGIFPVSTHLGFEPPVMDFLQNLNRKWHNAIDEIEQVFPLDFTQLQTLYGIDEVFDPITDRNGHVPFTTPYFAAMGTVVARNVCAWNQHPFKVIALDCDNTLWQGICGEDGPDGVQVTEPYRQLQQFMLHQYNHGMLLTLCSKNNETDVWDVFHRNPDMLLKKHHFVDWAINWEPKSGNLQTMAKRLNLGIDSFVMIDDNPLECEEVMTHQPEVLTLLLPPEPELIPLFLNHVWAFDKLIVTEEDQKRSQMYHAQKEREEVMQQTVSLEEFLSGLELVVSMNPMTPDQIPRVSQLTQRTNQFNLSTRRRSEDEIRKLHQQKKSQCWVIHVSDRFGDYGLTGVLITFIQSPKLMIDTFLLSCRVLGRNVETAILSGLKTYCQKHNLQSIEAQFIPTSKNKPLHDFLQNNWHQPSENLFTLQTDQISLQTPHVRFLYKRLPLAARGAFEKAPLDPPKLLIARPGDSTTSSTTYHNDEGTVSQWEQLQQTQQDGINTSKKFLDPPFYKKVGRRRQQYLETLKYSSGEMLREIPIKPEGMFLASANYVAPRDEIETKLTYIWAEQIGIPAEEIGIMTGFFDMGGSSLGIINLLSAINREFGIQMAVEQLFTNLNIETLAQHIKKRQGKNQKDSETDLTSSMILLNRSHDKNQNLFLFPPIVGYGIGYRPLAAGLDSHSLWAFNYIQTEERISEYADLILKQQPKGPYLLGGYSAGGNLAFEVSQELEKQGHKIDALIILDAFPKDFEFSYGIAHENNQFQEAVEQAMEQMGLEYLKDSVKEKIDSYSQYYNGLINRGHIDAPIYEIQALDREERERRIIRQETGDPESRSFPKWETLTKKRYTRFQGAGKHVEMFSQHFVGNNIDILNKILEQLTNEGK